jgi:hypothetical protein
MTQIAALVIALACPVMQDPHHPFELDRIQHSGEVDNDLPIAAEGSGTRFTLRYNITPGFFIYGSFGSGSFRESRRLDYRYEVLERYTEQYVEEIHYTVSYQVLDPFAVIAYSIFSGLLGWIPGVKIEGGPYRTVHEDKVRYETRTRELGRDVRETWRDVKVQVETTEFLLGIGGSVDFASWIGFEISVGVGYRTYSSKVHELHVTSYSLYQEEDYVETSTVEYEDEDRDFVFAVSFGLAIRPASWIGLHVGMDVPDRHTTYGISVSVF